MSLVHVSRRGFLSRAFGIGAASAVPADVQAAISPEQAWIILEQQWEYNGEFFVEDGESVRFQLFHSEAEAAAECLRLFDEFCATEAVAEFPDEVATYLEPGTYDPAEVTWDQLRAAGYRGPYRIQALHPPHRKSPP